MVIATRPALHLFCETIPGDPARWHFVLEALDGSACLDVSDAEPNIDGERLELLALVRGLEAIWQPSRLTVVSPSRFVRRGLEQGLADWKQQGWCWERFGQLVPIKHADLWRRVDAALRFHDLDIARRQLTDNEPVVPSRSFQPSQQENSWPLETTCPRLDSNADYGSVDYDSVNGLCYQDAAFGQSDWIVAASA